MFYLLFDFSFLNQFIADSAYFKVVKRHSINVSYSLTQAYSGISSRTWRGLKWYYTHPNYCVVRGPCVYCQLSPVLYPIQ